MDPLTGTFSAPRTGTYFFSLSGIASCRVSVSSSCKFNVVMKKFSEDGIIRDIGQAESAIDFERKDKTSKDSETFSIQATLDLQVGDKIWVEIVPSVDASALEDDSKHFTHFTGWLLQENITQSLVME